MYFHLVLQSLPNTNYLTIASFLFVFHKYYIDKQGCRGTSNLGGCKLSVNFLPKFPIVLLENLLE